MDRCSELASPTAPRTPRDFQWIALSGSKRTSPTDADFDIRAVHLGVHNRIGLWWDAQPNESRLSCGAELEGSQGKFYHTARKTFSGSIGDGRRQLQALLGCAPQVTLGSCPSEETKGHSPSLPWHRDCDAEWTDARNGPGPPHRCATGLSRGQRLENRTNLPDGCVVR